MRTHKNYFQSHQNGLRKLAKKLEELEAIRRAVEEANEKTESDAASLAVARQESHQEVRQQVRRGGAAARETSPAQGSLWRKDLCDGQGNPISCPPSFEEFVKSPAFMGQGGLSPRQWDFLRRGFSFDPAEVFSSLKAITILVALWGKGSGKTYMVTLVFAWTAFIICALRDPWSYFGIRPGEPLDIVNIAPTAHQAKNVFFSKLQGRLLRPCFQPFAPRLRAGMARFDRTPPGGGPLTPLLQMHSLHARAQSLEGHSPILAVIDEADGFEKKRGDCNADRCLGILVSSARSRFGSRFLVFVISYRRVADGFMDRMYAAAQLHPESHIYDEGSTFEIRPDIKREDFQDDYDRDPEQARCCYENIAPAAMGALLDGACLEACLSQRAPALTWRETMSEKPGENGELQGLVGVEILECRPDPGYQYFIHCDAGSTQASYALGMCHLETRRGVARGDDNVAGDNYRGHVLLDGAGRPLAGKLVVYFDERGQEAKRALTDGQGRHSLWLLAGSYTYAFYEMRCGPAGKMWTALEKRRWSYVVQAGIIDRVPTGKTAANGEPIMEQRRVYLVVEDAVIEWRPQPGHPVDLHNVQKALLQICQKFKCQTVSFDLYESLTFVQELRAQGTSAKILRFGGNEQMKIFKNFRSLVHKGLWSGLKTGGAAERANWQVRRLRIRGEKIEAGGQFKDLADVRAVAAYHAHQAAATIALPEASNAISGIAISGIAISGIAISGIAGDALRQPQTSLIPQHPNQGAFFPTPTSAVPASALPTAALHSQTLASTTAAPQDSAARDGYLYIVSETSRLYPDGQIPGLHDRGDSPISSQVPYRAD